MKKLMKDISLQYPPRITGILSERVELGKVEEFVTKLHDESECFARIKSLKEALNHGLIMTKVHRVIKFSQKTWLEPYIKMSTYRT